MYYVFIKSLDRNSILMVSSNSLATYALLCWFCFLTSEYTSLQIQGYVLHFSTLPMGSKEEGLSESHQNLRSNRIALWCYIWERLGCSQYQWIANKYICIGEVRIIDYVYTNELNCHKWGILILNICLCF